MKAVILHAGDNGTFKEMLGDKPKGMLEISDTTLLSIQIDTLYKVGIEDIVVVRGYGKEYIDIPGIRYYDNLAYADTGVVHSLFCAMNEFDDELLIIYGDVLFNEAALRKILEAKADLVAGTILHYEEALGKVDYQTKEMLTFDSNNCIKEIGKNLQLEGDNIGFFSGILKCSHRGAEILSSHYQRIREVSSSLHYLCSEDLTKIWLTDFLSELCRLGVVMHCAIFRDGWYEMDSIEDYQRLCNDTSFMSGILSVKTDWNERSNTYNNIQWVNKETTLDCMVAVAEEVKPKKILDLGTGTGKVLMAMHSAYPDADCYGIDISMGMMDKIQENGQGFNLRVGHIENLSEFADEFFDVVTARMVLHHSTDLAAVFREVKRVLKKGGKFIICEGNPPTKECLNFYETMFRYKETRHTFLVDDLMNLCIQANFDEIQAHVITMKNMSLNNWLQNAGVPFRNIDIIKRLHYGAEEKVKDAYQMQESTDDILMTWKFSVISAQK